MLDRKRISLIHIAKARLKLSDDDYRAILWRVAEVESATQLDELTFDDLMTEFERLGFRSTWKRQTGGYRAGMATPSQIGFMRGLWRDYRGEDDAQAFRHWLERFHKITDPRFATSEKATAILAALKSMVARTRAGKSTSAKTGAAG